MAKLFVANLDFGTSERDIENMFQRFGEVSEIEFIRDGRGLFRGFAFVHMADVDASAAITALDGGWITGRKIVVRLDSQRAARREKGRIRLVAQDGSFARIAMANGDDVFAPIAQIRDGSAKSLVGCEVQFELSRGHRGLVAREVRLIDGASEGQR